jgi:hypothetical protein
MLIFLGKNYLGQSDNPNATPDEGADMVAAHIRNTVKKMVEMDIGE